MRICSIADLHGNLPEIEKCDTLLIAGDISPLQIQSNMLAMAYWMQGVFLDWIKDLPTEQVILIAGNHDFYFQKTTHMSITELELKSEGKLEYLKDSSVQLMNNSEIITIYGTPWCHMFGNWPFMLRDSLLVDRYSKIPEQVDILLTHDAPFGTSDICFDVPTHKNDRHFGNIPLRDRMLEINYKYCIHGHLHSSNHEFENLGTGKVVNCSLLNEEYKLVYKPLYFEL